MATIKVRAVGGALVQDFDALDRGVRRFIGRTLFKIEPASCDVCGASMAKDAQVCPACSTHERPSFAKHEFKAHGNVVEISARAEHLQAIREGHLELVGDDDAEH